MKMRILAGVTVLSCLAAGCKKSDATPPGAPGGAPPAIPVTVNQPIPREVVEWDEFPGRLDAVETVEVRARVSGYLQSINFKDGTEVKKGDLLFVIDPRQYQMDVDHAQAELNQAQTKLELASNDFERAERLLKARAISAEDADSRGKARIGAEAAVVSARATVESAALNLEYSRITAPINGRASRRLMTEGNLVNGNQGQNSLLTTIVSLDPVYCYFDADENSVLKYEQLARDGKGVNLRDGKLECELELANETGFPHKGLLDFVDNHVDSATGTLRLRGIFSNPGPDRKLQPGYFARVRVPGSAKYPALLISDEAVGTDQGQKYVLVINNKNVAEYRPVKLGPLIEGLRVVREGLQPNDLIVVKGLMMLRPGATVAPTRENPVPAGTTETPTNAPAAK